MSDANVFRLLAEETMSSSSHAVNEDEKRALEELAVLWAQAALMSGRVVRSSWWPGGLLQRTGRRAVRISSK